MQMYTIATEYILIVFILWRNSFHFYCGGLYVFPKE